MELLDHNISVLLDSALRLPQRASLIRLSPDHTRTTRSLDGHGYLHILSSTADILVAAGDVASKPYHMTPLDFIDNLGPS